MLNENGFLLPFGRERFWKGERRMLHLTVVGADGTVRFDASGYEIDAVVPFEYAEGDKIKVSMSEGEFIGLQLDPTMEESVLCVPGRRFEYAVPFGPERSRGYHPDAFKGDEHRVRVRELTDEEIYGYRNIALNPCDRHGVDKYYPHAKANLVTREDPCFFERNAIEGVIHNEGHGNYPYHSWAGGAREDLEYTIDFGREVEIDKLVFFLRADFPHDTWWKSVEVTFSDGTSLTAEFEGKAEGQEVSFPKTVTKTVFLHHFKQVSTPLSWAALTQIQVYGTCIKKEIKQMEVRQASNAKDVKHYDTERLREEFHIANLFTKDNIRMVYSHIDRIITAGLMPVFQTLKLVGGKELASEYFLERREMGCINIGGKGVITVDGVEYEMNPRDGIYRHG